MWTLWRWSKTRSMWEFETQVADAELKRTALRNCRRRNLHGTAFKWREGTEPPTRRHFKRSVK
jgi:hypothetical protein